MGIKAKVNKAGETEYTFETEADLKVWLAATRDGMAAAVQDAPVGDTVVERMSALYKKLGPRQKDLVDTLRTNPEGITDQVLREKIGVQSNQALGGVIGGIAKVAKPLGLTTEHVVSKKFNAGNNNYTYRLTAEMEMVVRGA